MAKKETAKGYGARYGPKIREKHSKISKQQSGPFKCPYCNYKKAKRVAVGIWHCRKCDSKFTNKAYKVGKMAPIKSKIEEGFDFDDKEVKTEVEDVENQAEVEA